MVELANHNCQNINNICRCHHTVNLERPDIVCTNCVGPGKRVCVFLGCGRKCYACDKGGKGDCLFELDANGLQSQLDELQALSDLAPQSESLF